MARLRRRMVLLTAAVLVLGAVPGLGSPAQAAVRTCSTSTPVANRPALQSGDTGTCVTVAQKALVAKGYSVGAAGPSGDFGASTLRAVTAFQREYGLTVDGVVGQSTWTQLTTGPAYDRSRGPNDTSRVVLSYDDCPLTLAAFRTMVQQAKAMGVGLVLAPTGVCVQQYKAAGTDIGALGRANGQYVMNHSVSHPNLTTLTYAEVLRQLAAPGVVTNVGRPPYGGTNATVEEAYTAAGMRQWLWTFSTSNWTGRTQADVVSIVVRDSTPGATVLMHMHWNAFNPAALQAIKRGLAQRGLSVCRPYPGTTPVRLPRSLPC